MRKILIADSHYLDEHFMLGQRQYARQFVKDNWKAALVTNPLSPFNTVFGENKRSVLKRMRNHMKNGADIDKSLWYYVPFTLLPFHNNTFFDKKYFFNNYHRFMVPSLAKLIRKKDFSSVDVLWLGTAHQKFWLDFVDYKCSVFRLADNIKAFKKSGEILLEAQEKVIEAADVVCVTSKLLLEKYKDRYNHTAFLYLPNGVDLSHFIRENYIPPPEYRQIKKPVALYVGAIDTWFDFDLLRDTADKCPEISFVIIGADSSGKLKNMSRNIFYLGPKDYSQIPDYIYHSDCGIIPFDKSEIVQTVSPIKMYEFFSLGKPVISRAWDELKRLDCPCLMADTAEEFAEHLKDKQLFSQNNNHLMDYAANNSWESRYHTLVDYLERNSLI
jgi:hypothetical protein